jgi:membrane glycosyltransferase
MSCTDPNGWQAASNRRLTLSRLLSFTLIGGTGTATFLFIVMYGYPLWVSVPFVCAYISLGYLGMTYFVTMWGGFIKSLRPIDKDPYHPIHQARPLANATRIAVIMPVYHEDPRRVGGALGAMWEDLRQYGEAGHFDFFLVSDSRKIDHVVQEEWMVHELSRRYPDARFTYRRRSVNIAAKIGNVADFVKRWGGFYKYMLLLDADSIVPGKTMVMMAKMMEGRDKIGIIQANLTMVYRNTLFAKIGRFISALTLKIGFYGVYYFYMGKGYYYGHNAIIRTSAFIEHCALPLLKKKGPWAAGKPISHDYVEAALLDGAGFEIWSLPELESFEELPSNLIDDIIRETRWMYGSFVYFRVFNVARISPLYKARLFTSAINYFNAIFGWIFLLLGLFGMRYIFLHPYRSYETMSEYWPIFTFSFGFLIISILARMILPILYLVKTRQTHLFGGSIKIFVSYIFYFIYSLLIGMLHMAQFTRIIFYWLKGEKINWGEQNRGDRSLTWAEAFRHFWWVSAIGIALAFIIENYVFSLDTGLVQAILRISKWGLFFWYVPTLSGFILSVWLVRFLSMEFPILDRMGWFASPQDIKPHFVLTRTRELEADIARLIPETTTSADAIKHPFFYHFHRAKLVDRPRKFFYWRQLLSKPFNTLTQREKFVVFSDRSLFDEFHKRMWSDVASGNWTDD